MAFVDDFNAQPIQFMLIAEGFDDGQKKYFERIDSLNLDTPTLIGFGIHDKETYHAACTNGNGAIIGSAFIRALEGSGSIDEKVEAFISKLER